MDLAALLRACLGEATDRFDDLLAAVVHPPAVTTGDVVDGDDRLHRRVLAHALNLALFADLVDRVPSAAAYVAERVGAGASITLDHGAVRTVAWPTASALPAGIEQVTRILLPLGYEPRATYPLPKLKMTGRSFAHVDLPEEIGQWFVSELHPDEFSPEFQRTVERVLGTAEDPLDVRSRQALGVLAAEHALPVGEAVALLPVLFGCFRRLHAPPLVTDYEILVAESPEMAWIATEGTAFNHATDRVADVEQTASAERAAGRPIKERVEVSGSGRVRQTAHRAATVVRPFDDGEGGSVEREVPGSFFEFIDRARLPDGTLDLAFDTSNAQGIFAMTSTAAAGPAERGRGRVDVREAGLSGRARLVHAASESVPRPAATYRLRRRKLSPKRQAEFEHWIETWGLDPAGPLLDWGAVFDGHGIRGDGEPDVVLDVGFGHGESTIAMARAQPELCVVGSDVHTPGVVTVLDAVVNDPLPHVRVVFGDVLRLLDRIPAASLAGVRIFFPDPWIKARQHHRRLVRADTVTAIVDRLRPGGFLHLATDIADYAAQMIEVCAAEPRLGGGVIERPDWRPLTRFEQRGIDAGRIATDLWYERVG